MNEGLGRLLDALRFKKRDYQLTYNSVHGQNVMRDLAKFCRANETCAVPGDRDKTMMLEGRREVFLHINEYLHYTSQQLAVLYSGGSIKPEDLDNG